MRIVIIIAAVLAGTASIAGAQLKEVSLEETVKLAPEARLTEAVLGQELLVRTDLVESDEGTLVGSYEPPAYDD